MKVERDDPARDDVRALLEEHLRNMHEIGPPESVHALDLNRLKAADITFWSVRDSSDGTLLGCGALKQLDAEHGEVKSMRTPQAARRRGAGRAVLERILAEARARGYKRLSLETGSMAAFAPAHRLYESAGFGYCEPFGDYAPDPNSVFMTLRLESTHPLDTWHRLVRTQDAAGLPVLLAEDAVFLSPVVHTPQRGRVLAAAYLGAAFQVFFNPSFRYVRELVGEHDAMLEFETEIDGVLVNGVDLIKWNAAGRIVEFKVMLRPLKAINLVQQRMAAMLQAGKLEGKP